MRRLQSHGYTVDVPPNPLRGLAVDSAYLASFLATISGPVVLVGHSYRGAVITDAATGAPNVKALVYINPFAPDQGESVLQLVGAQPGSALAADPAQVFDVVLSHERHRTSSPACSPAAFANDLPPRQAAVLATAQRPLAASASSSCPGRPPGRQFRPGTSSAPPTTSCHPWSRRSWRRGCTPTRSASTRRAPVDDLPTRTGHQADHRHGEERALMDLELDGKIAVVTGASKGIGLAVVRTLAAEGALSSPARAPSTHSAGSTVSHPSKWIRSSRPALRASSPRRSPCTNESTSW